MKPKLLIWLIIPCLTIFLIVNYFIRGTRAGVEAKHKDGPGINPNFDKELAEKKLLYPFKYRGGSLVTLWFDDGWDSEYEEAFPVLDDKNIDAAIAIPTHVIGDNGYMNWWKVQKLQYEGWEITSHTRSHECEGDKISVNKLTDELEGSKKDLESYSLYAENYVAPCGTITNETTEEVRKHYKSQRTSEAGINPIPVKNPYLIKTYVLNTTTTLEDVKKMLTEVKVKKGWLVLAFHQIDDSGQEYSINPQLFKQIVEEVEKSGIQTALPVQVMSLN